MNSCIEDAGDNNEDGGRNKDKGDTRKMEATCTHLSFPRVYIRRRKGSNTGKTKTSEDVKVDVEHSLYLLKELLPYLKQLSLEEMTEKRIEASRQIIFSFKNLSLVFSCMDLCCFMNKCVNNHVNHLINGLCTGHLPCAEIQSNFIRSMGVTSIKL